MASLSEIKQAIQQMSEDWNADLLASQRWDYDSITRKRIIDTLNVLDDLVDYLAER